MTYFGKMLRCLRNISGVYVQHSVLNISPIYKKSEVSQNNKTGKELFCLILLRSIVLHNIF
jgi:hypothetical protein